MYKELFDMIVSLVIKPTEAWTMLAAKKEDDHEGFMAKYLYPLIGLITLCAFIGVLFTRKEFDVQIALKSAILALLTNLGGFYVASYLLHEIWIKIFHLEKNFKLCQRFVGYSSVLIFLICILLSLLPQFFFFRIFVFYTVYIVWEGADAYLKVDEEHRLKFTVINTVAILAAPFIIGLLLPGLRI